MKEPIITNQIGVWRVEGLEGFYRSVRIGAWNKVRYYKPVGDIFEISLAGNVSAGIYGSDDFTRCPNSHADESILECIKKHAARLIANNN